MLATQPWPTIAVDAALRDEARSHFATHRPAASLATLHPRSDTGTGTAGDAREQLGRALFFDTRLGSDGRTGCVSCHLPGRQGADGLARSRDARGRLTERNSPTVFDAAALPALRWRGDRRSAAHQAEDSIKGSMGHASVDAIVPVLEALGYGPAFAAAFPGATSAVSAAHFANALEAYQLTLVTRSRFDRYLDGEDAALSSREKRGLQAFMRLGCATCHDGPQLGGRQFRRFGIVEDYWRATGSRAIDVGRYAMTRDEADRFVFRVPILRHVARTAPYFHDGSVASLRDAVRIMAKVQLAVNPSGAELDALVEFLGTLDGEVPAHYSPPALPDAAKR